MTSAQAWLPALLGFGAGALAHSVYSTHKSCFSSDASSSSSSGVKPSSSAPSVELPLPLRTTKNNPALEIDILNSKQNLSHLDVVGKRVLMRVDYNVKIKKGQIDDTTRITSTIPTLRQLLSQKNNGRGLKCIVLITHLGRPAGNFSVAENTVEPIVPVLKQHLGDLASDVVFLPDCIGDAIVAATHNCKDGTVFLCENLRFHPEETGIKVVTKTVKVDGVDKVVNEKISSPFSDRVKFRSELSRLGDVFVFEAFGAAHRPHSSITGIRLQQRVAGLLMHKEMSYYGSVLGNPQRPFLAIIGGSKVSDKILVLKNMLNLVDEMIIGGGMAYTFLRIIHNVQIGESIFDQAGAGLVHEIVERAREKGVKLHFPVDHIIADALPDLKGTKPGAKEAKVGVTDNERGIPAKWYGLDIGPQTRSNNSVVIARAKTILWNGPLGVFESPAYSGGTISAMWDLAQATKKGATTIIGGGDTGSASKRFYVGNKSVGESLSHVSTGGGSSLVLMEGKLLPAVAALSNIGNNELPPPQREEDEPADADDE